MRDIKNKYTVVLFTVIFLFTMVSCEKEIDVNLKSVPPRIVIEGTIVQDSLAKVSITKTKDFDTDNSFPLVSGAIVTISDSEGNKEVLLQNNKGLYVSKTLRGKINVSYNLEVKLEDQVFTSSSTMPEPVKIDTIKMYPIPAFKYAVPMVVFQDPAGVKNYYRFILYADGVRMKIDNSEADDKQKDGILVDHILPVYDNNREDSRKIEKGETILVEMQSIDKGVYTFFNTLSNMGATENNPTSNITGGALGCFSAYSFDRMQIIADWND